MRASSLKELEDVFPVKVALGGSETENGTNTTA